MRRLYGLHIELFSSKKTLPPLRSPRLNTAYSCGPTSHCRTLTTATSRCRCIYSHRAVGTSRQAFRACGQDFAGHGGKRKTLGTMIQKQHRQEKCKLRELHQWRHRRQHKRRRLGQRRILKRRRPRRQKRCRRRPQHRDSDNNSQPPGWVRPPCAPPRGVHGARSFTTPWRIERPRP